jgi:hypothetical protein
MANAQVVEDDDHKAGMLRKRGSRMRNWSIRYIMLNGSILSYKVKPDSQHLKGTFDLTPGCIVTEVAEETTGFKGKKLFSFWIVWPQDPQSKSNETDRKNSTTTTADESDDEENHDGAQSTKPQQTAKDLKKIVETEVQSQRKHQQEVETQIQKHQAYDNSLSLGNLTVISYYYMGVQLSY